MIFDLVKDFADILNAMPKAHAKRRNLTLLDEAIRRDVHFIDRHPTTFFQCMWNTCWWYDSSEAAKHYDPPEGGWPKNGPPWQKSGEKLSSLLERWQDKKSALTPGFFWVRDRRPPRIHLGTAQKAVLKGHKQPVNCLAWSPDGKLIASGARDQSARLWDAPSGEVLSLLQGHRWDVYAIAFSPDGRQIACGYYDHSIRIWNTQTQELGLTLKGKLFSINRIQWSPDGNKIIAGSPAVGLQVWDALTGEPTSFRSEGFTKYLNSISGTLNSDYGINDFCCSPTGNQIATASRDEMVRVWDTESGELVVEFRGHSQRVNGVCYHPEGNHLISSTEESVLIWNCSNGSVVQTLYNREVRFKSVTCSPDGRHIACANELQNGEEFIGIWHLSFGELIEKFNVQASSVECLEFSSDGQHLASGHWDNTVRIWNTNGGEGLAILKPLQDNKYINDFRFSADGLRAYCKYAHAPYSETVFDTVSGLLIEDEHQSDSDSACQEFSKEATNGNLLSEIPLHIFQNTPEEAVIADKASFEQSKYYDEERKPKRGEYNKLGYYPIPPTSRIYQHEETRLFACTNLSELFLFSLEGELPEPEIEEIILATSPADSNPVLKPALESDSEETKMTFKEHLAELLNLLTPVALLWLVLTILFPFMLGRGYAGLISGGVFGALASAPLFAFQAWRFISLGLYASERTITSFVMSTSALLFAMLATLGSIEECTRADQNSRVLMISAKVITSTILSLLLAILILFWQKKRHAIRFKVPFDVVLLFGFLLYVLVAQAYVSAILMGIASASMTVIVLFFALVHILPAKIRKCRTYLEREFK